MIPLSKLQIRRLPTFNSSFFLLAEYYCFFDRFQFLQRYVRDKFTFPISFSSGSFNVRSISDSGDEIDFRSIMSNLFAQDFSHLSALRRSASDQGSGGLWAQDWMVVKRDGPLFF